MNPNEELVRVVVGLLRHWEQNDTRGKRQRPVIQLPNGDVITVEEAETVRMTGRIAGPESRSETR